MADKEKEKDKEHDKKPKGEKGGGGGGEKGGGAKPEKGGGGGASKPEKAKEPKKVAKIEGGEQLPPKVIRLRDKYKTDVVPALMEKFKFKNANAAPRLVKVCLNMGFGKAATDNNPKVG